MSLLVKAQIYGNIQGDPGNNNVGIGVSLPQFKLDVAGDINTTGNLFISGSYPDDTSYFAQREMHRFASVSSAGWYRVAQLGQLRGQNTVTIFTVGGDYAPRSTTIRWWHDWSSVAGINVISEYGDNLYWTQARVTDEGESNSFLEVYFTGSITHFRLMMQFDGGLTAGSVYGGSLNAGGGNVRAITATGPFSINDKLIVNPVGHVGIGTMTPKTNFDLYTSYSGGRIASFGTRLGYNEWNGIHIGYSEAENNLYRKAGIAFERVDAHTRGKLHFINDIDAGSSSFDLNDSKMVISENGNIGIGTSNPFTKLMLVNMVDGVNTARIGFYGQSGDGGNNTDNGGIRFINDNSPYYSEVAGFRGVDSQQAGLHFYTASNSVPSVKMTITPSGELGIGTENPGLYKLNVAGKIRADEIVVNTAGADFVFDSTYELSDLSEVEEYINENNHLPGIPSAEEMQKNGMRMSEMQTSLLQKIEEITLYLIELKKENSELKNEIQILKKAIK